MEKDIKHIKKTPQEVLIAKKSYKKYYKEKIEPYFKSNGSQKMWNYFLDILQKEYFINTIKDLRKQYNIPFKGIKYKNGTFSFPPEGHSHDEMRLLRNDIISKICQKYKLHYFDFSDILLSFVYYNFLKPLDEIGSCGLLRVSDVVVDREEIGGLFEISDDIVYPISIRISPYASQRDIVNFIENKSVWKNSIKFLQDKYKEKDIMIGRVRRKDNQIQKRNDYIFKHRNLSRKEIVHLVYKKFPELSDPIDEGSVGKVISLERKKRKEV